MPLAFNEGRPFADGQAGVFEAVLGAEVAKKLGYSNGERIVLSHGSGAVTGQDTPTSLSLSSAS